MTDTELVIPFYSPWHAPFVQAALEGCGVAARVVSRADDEVVHLGLSSVNNDACYSAILEVGQVRSELEDPSRCALRAGAEKEAGSGTGAAAGVSAVVATPSTCVGCRADDLPYLVARAIGPLNVSVHRVHETIDELPDYAQRRIAAALVGGDVLLQTKLHVAPRATEKGRLKLNALVQRERSLAVEALAQSRSFDIEVFARNVHNGAKDLIDPQLRPPSIGVVGSSSPVFNPCMNGDLVNCIEREGCEAVLPYLAPTVCYALFQQNCTCTLLSALDELCSSLSNVSTRYPCYTVGQLKGYAKGVVPEDVTSGQGWMLAGQMLALWGSGVRNILFVSVFGCMAGHVAGQGPLKRIRELCPGINLASVEYDPGTSVVNQVNRIKLLTSIAKRSAQRAGGDGAEAPCVEAVRGECACTA